MAPRSSVGGRGLVQLVADPDAHCGRYRLVVYTSAISEGFSYCGPCAGAFVSASNPNLTLVRYSQMLHRARGNFAQRWRLEQGVLCGLAHEAGIQIGLPTRDLLIALRGHAFFKDEIEAATVPVLSEHHERRAYGQFDINIRSVSENPYICAKRILERVVCRGKPTDED